MLALALLLVVADPSSQKAAELLAHGEKLLGDLEYGLAAEELMRVAVAPDATPEQRLRAHLLAGTANRVIGRDVDAQINFRYVLTNAPDTRLPDGTPPKVATFFEAVRQELENEQRVAAARAPPPATTTPVATTTTPPAAPVIERSGIPLGLVVAGGGAVVGVVGAAGLIGSEAFLGDPGADGHTRATVQTMGVVAGVALGVGVVVAAAGGALALIGS